MSQYYYNPNNFNSSNNNNGFANSELERYQRAQAERREIRRISFTMGCAIIAYLLVQMISALVLRGTGLTKLYNGNASFQYCFSVIAVSLCAVALPFGIVALINRKKYSHPVIPNKKLSPSISAGWIFLGMAVCCVLQVVINFVILFFKNVIGITSQPTETLKPDSIFACILSIVAIAIVPAICEEFAMRCCSLQLLRKYGKGFGVVAVSIVFGLLHGNLTQFVFAFCVALVLGFITVKTDSIVPAVFIHGLNNGMSALQMILLYASSEKVTELVVSAVYVAWAVLGVVSVIYLFAKKQFARGKKEYTGDLTIWQRFSCFLFPWMIIPFAELIWLTIKTIKQV